MIESPDDRPLDRRALLKGIGTAGVVGLAGCAGGSQTSSEPGAVRWIQGSTSGAQSLNPLEVSDAATTRRLGLLYDAGSVTTDGLQFEGRMLADYEVASDATSATYVLRDDLEWGAGYGQVTADDYVAFVEEIVFGGPQRKTGVVGYSQTSSYLCGGEPLDIEKLGKLEFRVSLPHSRGFWFLEDPLRTAYVVPASLIQKYKPLEEREVNGELASVLTQIGNDPAVRDGSLSGNLGPFDFKRWEKGNKLVLTANEDYYLSGEELAGVGTAGPALDEYTYQVFDEQSTAYSAIRAGDITSTGVEGRKVSEVSGADDVNVWESEYGEGTFFLSLNHRVNGWGPIRESREVRQAFAHLIDKDLLIDQIFDGYGDPISTFHEVWGPFYPDELPEFETGIEPARRKFQAGTGEEYGYEDDVFVGPDGEQVELTLVIVNTRRTGEIVGNYLKQRLAAAGIEVTLEGLSFSKIISTYLQTSVQNNPNYDGAPSYKAGGFNDGAWDEAIAEQSWDLLYGVGFSGNPFCPWSTINALLPTRSQFNFMGYRPAHPIAETVTRAASASSEAATRERMEELFRFLAHDQPLIWLYSPRTTVGYREGVGNLPTADSFWDRPDPRTLQLRGR